MIKKQLAECIKKKLEGLSGGKYLPVGEILQETEKGYRIRYYKIQVEEKESKEISWENAGKLYIATLLIHEYGYPESQIHSGKEVKVGHTGVRPDFLLFKKNKNRTGKYDALICEIKLGESEKTQKKTIRNQLTAPAAVLKQNFDFDIKQVIYINFEPSEEDCFRIAVKRYKYPATPEEVIDYGVDSLLDYEKDWNWESKVLVKGSERDITGIKSEKEFDEIFEKIHRLVASRTGGSQPQRAFRLFLNLLLTKIWDEAKTKEGEEYEFQYKNGEDDENFFQRINGAYESACREWLKLRGSLYSINVVDQTRRGPVEIPVEDLKKAVEVLQKYRIRIADKNTVRLIGESYEKILWRHFKQSKGTYFTHENIIRIISDGLEIPEDLYQSFKEKNYKKVIDPACGSGNFLVYIFKRCLDIDSTSSHPVLVNHHQVRNFSEKTFFGIDIEQDLVEVARIHMVVFGDGSGSIFEGDTLESKENIKIKTEKTVDFNSFDYVVSNPPFSIENPANPQEKGFSFHHIKGVGENQSEIFFIERFYQLLKPGGYLGVILPESIFDETSLKEFRLHLLEKFLPVAIISLPEHTFAPYANQITNIFLAKKREQEGYENEEEFLVSRINDVGYIRKKTLYQITGTSQIEDAIRIIKAFKNKEKENSLSTLPSRAVKLKDVISHEEYRMDAKFWLRNTEGEPFFHFFEPVSLDVEEEEENLEEMQEHGIDDGGEKLPEFVVETGDINESGIVIPKNIRDKGKFTLANYFRIIKKLNSGSFEKLSSGLFLISPARVYQGKIAYIPEELAATCLFSRAFIKLKPKKEGESYFYYYLLRSLIPEFVNVSVIGKRGYSFLRPRDLNYVRISGRILDNLHKNAQDLQEKFNTILNINRNIMKVLQEPAFY